MQTFMPYADFQESVRCLDDKRLNKQILECDQICSALKGTSGWKHHPAVLMWRGFGTALVHYRNLALEEWVRRGRNSTRVKWELDGPIVYPSWIGGILHSTHRSNLLRKLPAWYEQFGWTEPPDMEYYWPVRTSPRGIITISEEEYKIQNGINTN